MGKEGLRLVLLAFISEGIMKDDAPKAAEYYLENYRFIYQNPDDNTMRFPSLHHNSSSDTVLYCRTSGE